MKRSIASIVAVATLLLAGGCGGCGGGSTSQSEMIRRAMERKEAQQALQAKADKNAAPTAKKSTPRPASPPKATPKKDSAVAKPATVPLVDVSIATRDPEPPKQDSPRFIIANRKPDKPLSAAEQRQRTIENLQQIGRALVLHVNERRCFPAPAVCDKSYSPLLSWRVVLLPYLGYEDLYGQFRLDEPWDSPHNRDLLSSIPPVYQSPDRFDERTNYQVPLGAGAAFSGNRGVAVRKIEDGVVNTVVLLEVDDELAVPWTKPDDYRVDYAKPAEGVGELRAGHFFVVWGDGTVGQVSLEDGAKYWKALTSIDGGEPFSASQISQAPVVEPAPPEQVADVSADVKSTGGPETREPAGKGPTKEQSPSIPTETQTSGDAAQDDDNRSPVPPESARRLALDLFREIFQSEYEDADTDEERLAFAEKIRAHADGMQEDTADRYVLLDLSAVIAAQAGSVTTALEAADDTERLFQTDAMDLRAKVLESTAGRALAGQENEAALQAATDIIDQAILIDDFDLAARTQAVALAAARRSGDKRLIHAITDRKGEIAAARAAFLQVGNLIDALADDPNDSEANLAVGEYYCFVKGKWEDGLPMLSRGSDLSLAHLAKRDLSRPDDSREKVDLADNWWERASRSGKSRKAMRLRAVHWYEQALPELSPGLERVKAEVRIRQLEG